MSPWFPLAESSSIRRSRGAVKLKSLCIITSLALDLLIHQTEENQLFPGEPQTHAKVWCFSARRADVSVLLVRQVANKRHCTRTIRDKTKGNEKRKQLERMLRARERKCPKLDDDVETRLLLAELGTFVFAFFFATLAFFCKEAISVMPITGKVKLCLPSAVASWYCWYSLTRSFMFDSASVNSYKRTHTDQIEPADRHLHSPSRPCLHLCTNGGKPYDGTSQ